MVDILTYLHLLAAAVLVGKNVFMSFVAAPVFVQTLNQDAFTRLVRLLIPRYYALGMIAAAAGWASVTSLGLLNGFGPAGFDRRNALAGRPGHRKLLPRSINPAHQCVERPTQGRDATRGGQRSSSQGSRCPASPRGSTQRHGAHSGTVSNRIDLKEDTDATISNDVIDSRDLP